jgi:hypothetical protein
MARDLFCADAMSLCGVACITLMIDECRTSLCMSRFLDWMQTCAPPCETIRAMRASTVSDTIRTQPLLRSENALTEDRNSGAPPKRDHYAGIGKTCRL